MIRGLVLTRFHEKFACTYFKPFQSTKFRIKDASMNTGSHIGSFFCLTGPDHLNTLLVCLHSTALNSTCLEKIYALLNDIQFHQAAMSSFWIFYCIKLFAVQAISEQ